MKFFNVLALASLVIASPAARLDTRAKTVVGTITDAVGTLKKTVDSDTASLDKAVKSASGSAAGGAAKVQAAIKDSLKEITDALNKAAKSGKDATAGGASSIVKSVADLSKSEVNELIMDLKDAANAVAKIGVSLQLAATNLTPDVKKAVQSEVNNVKSAIGPVVAPILKLADAASKAKATAGADLKGVAQAQAALTKIFDGLVKSLGLPSVDLPKAPQTAIPI